MRKFLIPIVAAASALTIAAPAAAQWAPPVYRYAPYNYGRGYNGYSFAHSMMSRVQRIRGDIRALESRRIVSVTAPALSSVSARSSRIRRLTGSPSTSNACTAL